MINHPKSENTAEILLQNLENLDIHEVWDNAGSTRYGYVDPNELADEMLQEVLQPFFDELKELTEDKDKKAFALELIKGLEQFKESPSEFKHWAVNSIDQAIAELKESL